MVEFTVPTPSPTNLAAAGVTALLIAGRAMLSSGGAPVYPMGQSHYWKTGSDQSFSFFGTSSSPRQIPNAFVDSYREMLSFKALGDGWDGVGSEQMSNATVDTALAFLNLLPPDVPAPEPSASGDGTVDWYWRSGDHSGIVTFHKDGTVAYYVRSGGGIVKDSFALSDSIPAELVDGLRRI